MKILKKIFNLLTSPFTLGLIVTLVITFITLNFYTNHESQARVNNDKIQEFIRKLHQISIDLRMKDRGPQLGSDRVAVLTIDEKAIEQEGRWPWPREKVARTIEKTIGYGAKVISFDIIFSEEDPNSSVPTLSRVQNTLSDKQLLNADIKSLLANEIQKANSDQYFAAVVNRSSDHLVMGTFFDEIDLHEGFIPKPYTDLCIDQQYKRTYDFHYWDKDAIPPVVLDSRELRISPAMSEHLITYLTLLEDRALGRWLASRADVAKKLADLASSKGLPEELGQQFAHEWLNGDLQGLKATIYEQAPELKKSGALEQVEDSLEKILTKKDSSSIKGAMREETESYCLGRFMSENDELHSEKLFLTKWNDPELFNQLGWDRAWPEIAKSDSKLQDKTAVDVFNDVRNRSLLNPITIAIRWVLNIPALAEGTKHTGFFNAQQDSDGSIRRARLIVRRGNRYFPSLALKEFLVDNNYGIQAKIEEEQVGSKDIESKIVTDFKITDANGDQVMQIPVDNQGRLLINYSGKKQMFPHFSAAEVLNDNEKMNIDLRVYDEKRQDYVLASKEVNKKEFLKDKLLIFGATATGIYDLRVTPFEENFPGVETHATVLSNLLTELGRAKGDTSARLANAPGFLRTHADEPSYMLIVMLVLGIALSALLSHFGSILGLLITASTLGLIYVIDKFFLFKSGIVITVLFPIILTSSLFVILTFYKYFTEERKKRELKGTFEKYVSPSIVAEVLANPENIELGGKKMELTVMFSDVRGFTTISEKLDPRALSDLLNSYLTPMTNLVFEHKGTLDKYMGDAVMAFWGAPVHFKDHAQHACRCALAMLVKLEELRAQYRAQGLPDIDIGIGLNTGDMSVGNMGSDTVRSYTVMGDAVNLGSRLEGINKQYGTRIIISEFTQRAIGADFITREVDWVRVKGKVEPVRIFELVAEKKVDEKKQLTLTHFNAGFGLYHERKFQEAIASFTKALEADPEDECSQLYLERCQEYIQDPPAADWDGVFTMTSK